MIQVTKAISISEKEIHFIAIRASGPGGQHVNKSSTAIQLKFNIHSSSLPVDIMQRLRLIAGSHLSNDDTIIIKAQNHRSQRMNKAEALNRLKTMIVEATNKPKTRRQTSIPRKEKVKRLRDKKYQSLKKEYRKPPKGEND